MVPRLGFPGQVLQQTELCVLRKQLLLPAAFDIGSVNLGECCSTGRVPSLPIVMEEGDAVESTTLDPPQFLPKERDPVHSYSKNERKPKY